MTTLAQVTATDPVPTAVPGGYRRCVRVKCPFCAGAHWHDWPNGRDRGLREPPCSPGGRRPRFYTITFDKQKERTR